jgi:translation initiation factor 2 subunit 2
MEYSEMLRKAMRSLPEKSAASRFEMPKAVVHPVGKSTIVKNFADIARTVRRNTTDIAKFLFKELGVPGEIRGNDLILNGKVGEKLLNQRLEEYVKDYVLCRECGKPDTDIKKDGVFILKCQACGARRSFT